MHAPHGVGVGEPPGRLLNDVHRPAKRERSLLFDPLTQAEPVHELHGEVTEPILTLSEVEDGDDVRMPQLARELRFTPEALEKTG